MELVADSLVSVMINLVLRCVPVTRKTKGISLMFKVDYIMVRFLVLFLLHMVPTASLSVLLIQNFNDSIIT